MNVGQPRYSLVNMTTHMPGTPPIKLMAVHIGVGFLKNYKLKFQLDQIIYRKTCNIYQNNELLKKKRV